MLVRHVCSRSRRIAEMKVPACPIPIHQTKLMMPNAQPTGMLLPQRPMPVHTVAATAATRTPETAHAAVKARYHGRGGRLQTGERSRSVRALSLRRPIRTSRSMASPDLRVGVVDPRQVLGAGAGPEVVEHLVHP